MIRVESKNLPETLFHYCSTSTFGLIFGSKNIRLSSVLLSNDYREGKIVGEIVRSFIQIESGIIDLEFISKIFDDERMRNHGIACCLSEEGDLLSQWRGYAADGAGIAIGFSRAGLEQLCSTSKTTAGRSVELHMIYYVDPSADAHRYSEVAVNVNNARATAFENIGGVNHSNISFEELMILRSNAREAAMKKAVKPFINDLYKVKGTAFREEKEWRLLSFIRGDESDSVEYQPKDQLLVPYDQLALPTNNLITHIMLGPKNKTPECVIRGFLKAKGFSSIAVQRSRASYT